MKTYLKISLVFITGLVLVVTLLVATNRPASNSAVSLTPTAHAPPIRSAEAGGNFRFAAFEPDTLGPTDGNEYGGENPGPGV